MSSSSPSGLNLLKWMLKSASDSAFSNSAETETAAGWRTRASGGQRDGVWPGLLWLFTGLDFCFGGDGRRALGNPMLFRASRVPSGSIIALITDGGKRRRGKTTVDAVKFEAEHRYALDNILTIDAFIWSLILANPFYTVLNLISVIWGLI